MCYTRCPDPTAFRPWPGVRGLSKRVTGNRPRPRAWIVGEPTSMQLIGGNKGTRVYHSAFVGAPAHSSQPSQGANAIVVAARLVEFLERFGAELAAAADPLSPFDSPCSTLNVGALHGGTAHTLIDTNRHRNWCARGVTLDEADALQEPVLRLCGEEIVTTMPEGGPPGGAET